MSVLAESIPVRAPAAATARVRVARAGGAEVRVEEGILELPEDLPLHHGGRLAQPRIAWRLAGALDAPVVCALGGISAHRRVCLTDDARDSWWAETAGPQRALDTERLAVLSFDYLGGSGGSSGPVAGTEFPSISS
jgi:homoserine acetyltransferase